jgi:hypothetical protein
MVLVFMGQASAKKIKLFGRPHQQKVLTPPNTAHVIRHTPTSAAIAKATPALHKPLEVKREERQQRKDDVVEVRH